MKTLVPKQPLEIVEVDLEGPEGRRGADRDQGDRHLPHRRLHAGRAGSAKGLFPSILGHEGAGVVVEVGPGVTSVEAGRPRDPPLHARMPPVQNLPVSGKTNLCTAIRATQGKGLMPDGTSRFSYKGQTHPPTTWAARPSRTTRCCPRSRWPRSARTRRSRQGLLRRLRRDHGRGRGDQHRQGRAGRQRAWCSAWAASASTSSRALKLVGRQHDRRRRPQPDREEWGRKFGMTHFVNPKDVCRDVVVAILVELTDGGADYTLRLHGQHRR